MKILIIAAHPDDEIYGMGGTIAKLTSEGNECYSLIITEGCTTQYPGKNEIISEKQTEAKRANAIIGIQKVLFGNLPDMQLDHIQHISINQVIEKAIELIRPKCVYTHFYGDVNKDHQAVYASTLVAVRPVVGQCVKELYCYQVPSSTEWSPCINKHRFMPNVFVDITKYAEQKEKAIMAYNTEIREYPHPRSIEAVKKYDEALAITVGLKRAEALMLLRKVD